MVNYKTWLKELNDDTKLGKLSIPGTHNSAACHTALPSVQCQGESVTKQLEHGDTLDEVFDFLKDNSSETVILSVKQEGTGEWNNDKDEFGNVIWDKYVKPNKDKFYLGTDLPRLGDARGKVILFRRFGDNNEGRRNEFGFDAHTWKYNCTEDDRGPFCVQDFCEIEKADDVPKKVEYVKNLAKKASEYNRSNDDGKLFINFCSGSNFFDHECWPQQVAKAMEEHKLQDSFDKGSGVIVLDYVESNDWKMAKELIDKNFK
ncbi:hypothetical protein SBP28_004237 [Candidozyma auris]|nr:hypothetical protein CJJ09_004397 [[Candida] auris]